MDIHLDLRLEGELDLCLQGRIGLEGGNAGKRSRIQQSPRRLRALGGPDPANGETNSPGVSPRKQETAQQRRALNRAAMKTRRAIRAVKEAMKRADDQRVRHETERLREAAVRLGEAVQRPSAATAADQETFSRAPDVGDAEFADTGRSDRKPG
jgi:hypothetical protein